MTPRQLIEQKYSQGRVLLGQLLPERRELEAKIAKLDVELTHLAGLGSLFPAPPLEAKE